MFHNWRQNQKFSRKRGAAQRERDHRRAVKATSRRLFLEPLEARTLMAVDLPAMPDWQEQGPGPIVGGNATGIPLPPANTFTNPVIGAIEAIAVHPANPKTVYVGSASGGIWRTEDITAATPSWEPLTDSVKRPGIADIAFDPRDPSGNTLFAAIGNVSSSFEGGSGGLLKTIDGGLHWTVIRDPLRLGSFISNVVPTSIIDPTTNKQVILVADSTKGHGVLRSTDGGQTFRQLGAISGLPPNAAATQLVRGPFGTQRFFAAIPGHGVFRSTNGGQNWLAVNTGLAGVANAKRIELVVSSDAIGAIYAAILTPVSAGQQDLKLTGLFRSTDGDNWTAVGGLQEVQAGHLGQHFSLLADPKDSDIVYVGGRTPDTELFRVNTLTGQWKDIAGAQADGTAPHPDSRAMAAVSIPASGQVQAQAFILEADEGGRSRLRNPAGDPSDSTVAARPNWDSRNGNLRIAEVFSVGYDALNNVVFAGTQSNGSAEQFDQNHNGTIDLQERLLWRDFLAGDGNTQAAGIIDLGAAGKHVLRYSMGSNFSSFIRREFDADGNKVSEKDIQQSGGFLGDLTRRDGSLTSFDRIPFVLNRFDPWRVLMGKDGLY